MNKKGFTVAEVVICLGIIAVIIAIIIPVTQGFLAKANILDANLKAKNAYNVINLYLLEQEINGNGMRYNGKFSYVAIAAGDTPILFDADFDMNAYAAVKAKNDFITSNLIEVSITDSIWVDRSYPHRMEITKKLDKSFDCLLSCFVAAVISDNKAAQVFYVPNTVSLGFDADYREVEKFFTAHCVIKGKTDNIAAEPDCDMGTVFYIKENVITEGRSTADSYKGMIVGTSPVVGG